MRRKDIAIGIFALGLLAALVFLWVSPAGGKRLPEVEITALDGERLVLKELAGKPMIITFWATTCPGCIEEMPHLVALYREFAPRLEILAIAMAYDPPAQVREMVSQRQLPYRVAWDAEGEVAEAFGRVRLTPTTFLVAPDGRIVQQTLGALDVEALRGKIRSMLAERGR